jgi:phosphoribosyl 1,2-cyclic phosphodiesterase
MGQETGNITQGESMIKFCVLGSGSKGNAIYFNVDGRSFMVDCGFTKKETSKRLATIGKTIDDIEAVFVTHEHKDHSAPWITKDGLIMDGPGYVQNDLTTHMDTCTIKMFDLSHDSDAAVGYFITDKDNNKVAIVVDTGCIPEEALGRMFDCAAILIETNYDVDMLAAGKYPTELLERIASDHGHLRNECAAEAVEMVAGPELKFVVCLHLSASNNNPELVKFCMNSVVANDVEVTVAQQKAVGRLITVM